MAKITGLRSSHAALIEEKSSRGLRRTLTREHEHTLHRRIGATEVRMDAVQATLCSSSTCVGCIDVCTPLSQVLNTEPFSMARSDQNRCLSQQGLAGASFMQATIHNLLTANSAVLNVSTDVVSFNVGGISILGLGERPTRRDCAEHCLAQEVLRESS